MKVFLVVDEVLVIANSVVGETTLPDFPLAADDRSEGMRVSAFD
jgi:hypothetical protein